MSVRLYAMTCGWLTAPLGLLLDGEKGDIRIPVPSYLIDHPKGKLLFDSGLNPRVLENAEAHLGYLIRYFQPHLGTDDLVAKRLETLDIDVRHRLSRHVLPSFRPRRRPRAVS